MASAASAASIVARVQQRVNAAKEMHGIVVSAGLMDKTVKVRLGGQRYEPRVHKWFKEPRYKLVHDPANSLRQGDVVAISTSWRESQHVRHVVKHIIAPYGPGIDERPPIPTMQERAALRQTRLILEAQRREVRRELNRLVAGADYLVELATRAVARYTKLLGEKGEAGASAAATPGTS